MKRPYLSPAIEIVTLDTEALAASIIRIGPGKADGSTVMAKPNTFIIKDEDEDDADVDAEEIVVYRHVNLWEDE